MILAVQQAITTRGIHVTHPRSACSKHKHKHKGIYSGLKISQRQSNYFLKNLTLSGFQTAFHTFIHSLHSLGHPLPVNSLAYRVGKSIANLLEGQAGNLTIFFYFLGLAVSRLMFLLALALISAGKGDISGSTHHNYVVVLYYTHAFRPRFFSRNSGTDNR